MSSQAQDSTMHTPPASPGKGGMQQKQQQANSGPSLGQTPTPPPGEDRRPTNGQADPKNDDETESIVRSDMDDGPMHPPENSKSSRRDGNQGYPSPPGSTSSRTRRRRRGRRSQQPQQQMAKHGSKQASDGTIPPREHGTSWEAPYPARYQDRGRTQGQVQQYGSGAAASGVPSREHPVQVPVRVVNPDDVKGSGRGGSSGGSDNGGNLRLKLDLDLDVEVTLKASLRGEVSLSLL